MNIELNGNVYQNDVVTQQINNYVSYLEGVLRGDYRLSQDQVEFLNIDSSKIPDEINEIIHNFRNFNPANINANNYDFNADGQINTANSQDLNLLSLVLQGRFSETNTAAPAPAAAYSKNDSNLPADIANIFAQDPSASSVVRTDGGYYLSMYNCSLTIFNPQGERMSRIWGDPHVQEFDPSTGRQTGDWHYTDDSVFVLPDGTKLTLNSVDNSSASEMIYNLAGVYIQSKDSVMVFGTEYGANRDNEVMSDDTEGEFINSTRVISTNPEEWDAQTRDLNGSNYRNGVFVLNEENNNWMALTENGSFKDVNNEAWGSFITRQDRSLSFGQVQTFATRAQMISTLDGEDVTKFSRLQNLNLGNSQTSTENDFLTHRSLFTSDILNTMEAISLLGANNFEYSGIYNGNLNAPQVIEFLSNPTTKLSVDTAKDTLMKQYLLENFYPGSFSPAADFSTLSQNEVSYLSMLTTQLNLEANTNHTYHEAFSQFLGILENPNSLGILSNQNSAAGSSGLASNRLGSRGPTGTISISLAPGAQTQANENIQYVLDLINSGGDSIETLMRKNELLGELKDEVTDADRAFNIALVHSYYQESSSGIQTQIAALNAQLAALQAGGSSSNITQNAIRGMQLQLSTLNNGLQRVNQSIQSLPTV